MTRGCIEQSKNERPLHIHIKAAGNDVRWNTELVHLDQNRIKDPTAILPEQPI